MAQQPEITPREEPAGQGEQAPDVEHGGDLPVGVQLNWRLEALIRSGGLAPGARLPGVRELAAGVGVNVNTARAVYRRLEQEGLALSIQGSGTFVAPTVRVSPARVTSFLNASLTIDITLPLFTSYVRQTLVCR